MDDRGDINPSLSDLRDLWGEGSMACKLMKVTNMATGEEEYINPEYIVRVRPFSLDGKGHCFIDLIGGKQVKTVESMRGLGL